MAKKQQTVLELSEALAKEGTTSIREIQLDFTLPPPVYGYHLSTDAGAASKQIKIVSSIEEKGGFIQIEALTGEVWRVPLARIKFLVED